MGFRVELEMLAVLLLLTPIAIDGLDKCEMAEKLKMFLPADVPDGDMMAKIVYSSEQAANFSTSLIKQVPAPAMRKRRGASTKPPAKASAKHHAKAATKPPAKPTTKATTQLPPKTPTITQPPKNQNSSYELFRGSETNQTKPPMLSESNDKMFPPTTPNYNSTYVNPCDNGTWTLYGAFQLVGCLVCTSPMEQSYNICNMSCSALLDNDLTDDAKCASTVIRCMTGNPDLSYQAKTFFQKLKVMFMSTLPNINGTQYLAECNKP